MASITINTVLTSDTLALPELRPLLGKRVEIRVTKCQPWFFGLNRTFRPGSVLPQRPGLRWLRQLRPGLTEPAFQAGRRGKVESNGSCLPGVATILGVFGIGWAP